MGVFAFFSYSARSVEVEEKIEVHPETVQEPELLKDSPTLKTEPEPELATAAPTDVPLPSPPTPLAIPLSMPSQSTKPDDKPVAEPQNRIRRFSWTFRSLSFESKPPREEHKHALSTTQEHEKKAHATAAFSKRFIKGRTSNSEKRAKESALIVRSLIIGPSAAVSPQLTSAYAKPQLSKIKSQLIKPKSANKVIAQLRALPVSDAKGISDGRGPIHAVCLEHTDAEEHELHFACLAENIGAEDTSAKSFNIPGVSPISLERLTAMFNDMTVVDLVTSPDLGLGQPGNGKGILAGAVPTAETVLKGIVEITPQLMALGYATGQSILPDHAGIYPPIDRMSILTYWWGLELVLPPPSLEYLANAQSITGTVVNFLSALSLINNGVREILPFVRYIAQFIDYEFSSIQKQDKGQGVVCAATWIMPAAMVPRPWDFPDPPVQTILPIKDGDKPASNPPATPPSKPKFPLESTAPPFAIPLPLPQLPIGQYQASADPVPLQPAVPTRVAPAK